jgi:starch phosphorylase
VIDWIAGGYFSSGDAELFRPIVDSLLYHDEYLLFADYESYLNAQADAEVAYVDQERWTRMSILNTARCGFFSSDRAMLEYNRDIWKASLLVLPENL